MYLFKEYLLVGGMPQALKAYKNGNKDFYAADVEKEIFLNSIVMILGKRLKDTIQGYLPYLKVFRIFIHTRKKGCFGLGESNRSFGSDGAFIWLDDSMICNLCYKCTDPNVGFAF